MISELLFQKAVDFIIKHKRSLLTISAITLILFIVIKIFSSYALVTISVKPVNSASTNPVTLSLISGTTTENLGTPGLKFISRSVKNISASQGSYIKSQATVDIPWYGVTEVKLSLNRDKNADKIAYTNVFTNPCSAYSPRLENLLSFDCDNPLSLTNKKQDNEDSVIKMNFVNTKAVPYLGGVAGFATSTIENANGAVLIVSDSGKVSSFATPKEIDRDTLDQAHLFTNTNDPNDSRVVIVDSSGTVYLGSPTQDLQSVTYTQYKAPDTYTQNNSQTKCAFGKNNDIYCYRGPVPIDGEKQSAVDTAESITKLSFATEKAVVTSIRQSRSDLTDFFATSNGDLYSNYSGSLSYLKNIDDVYERRSIAEQISSVSVSDSVYYIQNGGVYKYNNNSAEQIFYSENITPKKLYLTQNRVYVIGSIANTQSSFYAYLINDQEDITPGKRTIDLLPTQSANLPMVSSQELIGNQLFLTLKVTIDKKARSFSTAVNQAQVGQAQEDVRNTLNNRGIDTNNLTIKYNY